MRGPSLWGSLRVADRDRREEVRAAGLIGLDTVDVESNGRQPVLRLVFLASTPQNLVAANVVVSTPSGAPAMHAVSVEHRRGDDTAPEHLTVRLDRHGGPGVHTLRLVDVRRDGSPSTRPPRGTDPQFTEVAFSFDVQRPPPLPRLSTQPPHAFGEDVPNSYLGRDYEGLRDLLLRRLAVTQPSAGETHVADLTVMLVELFAYIGDELSYAQDDATTEAYLTSARRRISVRRHARLVGYRLHEGCNARAWVCVEVAGDVVVPVDAVRFVAPGGAADPGRASTAGPGPSAACFTPVAVGADPGTAPATVTWRAGHNHIGIWTFGEADAWLLAGSTSVSLVDGAAVGEPSRRPQSSPARTLSLEVGDVLVLEGVRDESGLGPADPTARHAVRLTAVDRRFDSLFGQPYVDVSWDFEDAMPFDLRVSAPAAEDAAAEGVDAEGAATHGAVACARALGNVVLVGHGRPTSRVLDLQDPVLREPGLTFAQDFPRPFVVARHQARELRQLVERLRAQVASWQRQADHGWPLDDSVRAELVELFGQAGELPGGDSEVDAWQQADLLADLLPRLDRLLSVRRDRAEELAERCEADGVLDAGLLAELARDWGESRTATLHPESSAAAGPAATAMVDDPRQARPLISLVAVPSAEEPDVGLTWTPQLDLLRASTHDHVFVVEVDSDGFARLRFPDGAGLPASGRFTASCWLGNGPAGNVGAETISAVEIDEVAGGIGLAERIVRVRNPLPASGGTSAEDVDDARRSIPGSFSVDQPRALAADDYATHAAGLEGVRAAAAVLRFTGTGRLVDVSVRSTATSDPPEWFLQEVGHRLDRVRRIGDQLRVLPPQYRALYIELDVTTTRGANPAAVERRIQQRLGSGTYRDADGSRRPAMFSADAVSFGQTIWSSAVVAAVQRLPGVRNVSLLGWGSLPRPDRPPGRPADRIRCTRLEMFRLDGDPVHPEHGYVEVHVEVPA